MLWIKPFSGNKQNIVVILFAAVLTCSTVFGASSNRDTRTTATQTITPAIASAASNYPWQLELIDAEGQAFSLADYRGKTLLLSFFYTTCGYACPIQTARLAQVQKLLKDKTRSASRFVSVSIHPHRDTPQAIDAFKRPYGIDQAHWQFGAPTESGDLKQLLMQAGIGTRQMEEPAQTDHTMKILLIDPAGKVMQRYVGDKFSIKRVAKEVDTLVRLRSRS